MTVSYYIRRGTTVHGPFSEAKLKVLAEKKKLKKGDRVSESTDGPWEPLASAYQRLVGSAQGSITPTVAMIETWKVKRSLLGQYQVYFRCPKCKEDLKSGEIEVLQRDSCAACGTEFVLDQRVADEISSLRERLAAEREAKAAEKQQRRLEHRQEVEEQWQIQEQKDREHREPLQQVGVFPERAHISAYQSSSTASCSSSGKSRRFVVQCPFCKETISADAVKCSHCRSAVGAAEKSDVVAGCLGLLLGPVGLWYKGHWAAGFAWLAMVMFCGIVLAPVGWVLAPVFWFGMGVHASCAETRG